MRYQIAPIRQSFLNRARQHATDDQGQAVEYVEALGGEPCRDVLRAAKPGERLILASYCPFSSPGPYREYGPVFILAKESAEGVENSRLSQLVGGASNYIGECIVLRAYSQCERIVNAKLVPAVQAESALDLLFNASDVSFVLVRYPAYGCYSLRIERA